MREIFSSFINLVFPPLCAICKVRNVNFLCDKCKKKVVRISDNFCFKCGDIAEGKIIPGAICGKCRTTRRYFTYARSLALYQEPIKELIHLFKYKNKKYLSKPLTNFLIEYLAENSILSIKAIDLIIPIPLHKKRLKQRGFNQSEILAENISKYFNVKFSNNILFRIKETLPQFSLTEKERKENLKGAFEIKNIEEIKNKKILLIDDIYTTGSTMIEASKTLIKGKPKAIYCLTVAR